MRKTRYRKYAKPKILRQVVRQQKTANQVNVRSDSQPKRNYRI